MSKELDIKDRFTPEQIALVKSTIAKDATDDELRLFLYRATNMGLDPFKPGQIHFRKYPGSAGTIIVGLDGFRTIAARTGRHNGTERGVLKDANGKLIGAWAEVSRSDWPKPAREEVSFAEYTTGKSTWLKLPETMIKKCAEAAALRMAFPNDLGGVYVQEEMDQAEFNAVSAQGLDKAKQVQALIDKPADPVPDFDRPEQETGPGERAIGWGKTPTKLIQDLDLDVLQRMIDYVKLQADAATPEQREFLTNATSYQESL